MTTENAYPYTAPTGTEGPWLSTDVARREGLAATTLACIRSLFTLPEVLPSQLFSVVYERRRDVDDSWCVEVIALRGHTSEGGTLDDRDPLAAIERELATWTGEYLSANDLASRAFFFAGPKFGAACKNAKAS